MILFGSDNNLNAQDLAKDAFVIYIGHHGDQGAYLADLVIPASAYTEKSCTYINTEGRVLTTKSAV